jgi:hypothetical protein
MKRTYRHIALVCALALTVATVGLPVAVVYCSMQRAVTVDTCCCTHDGFASGQARIGAASCMTVTNIGAPITSAFEKQVVQPISAIVPIFSLPIEPLQTAIALQVVTVDDGSPPPLERCSILRI